MSDSDSDIEIKDAEASKDVISDYSLHGATAICGEEILELCDKVSNSLGAATMEELRSHIRTLLSVLRSLTEDRSGISKKLDEAQESFTQKTTESEERIQTLTRELQQAKAQRAQTIRYADALAARQMQTILANLASHNRFLTDRGLPEARVQLINPSSLAQRSARARAEQQANASATATGSGEGRAEEAHFPHNAGDEEMVGNGSSAGGISPGLERGGGPA